MVGRVEPRPGIFLPVLDALNRAAVRYVVVGGIAVVLRGHPRLTVDLDLVVHLDPQNALRAMEALEGAGLRPVPPVPARDFADANIRAGWVRDKGMIVFSLRDPDFPIRQVDVFVEHPIDFDALWSRSSVETLDGIDVRVASVDDLLEMKRRAGRPKDILDIEALETLRDSRRRDD